jgi:transcription antitermination factor NusG
MWLRFLVVVLFWPNLPPSNAFFFQERFRVAEGALAGLDAVVTQILPARARVRVLLDFLGRKVEAELECYALFRSDTPSKDS